MALFAQFGENHIDAFFIDDPHALRGHAQLYKAPLAFDPEPMNVQIRQKTAAGLIVGMRYIVSGEGTLARYLADSGHWIYLQPANRISGKPDS
jgi:hypothetical protein